MYTPAVDVMYIYICLLTLPDHPKWINFITDYAGHNALPFFTVTFVHKFHKFEIKTQGGYTIY